MRNAFVLLVVCGCVGEMTERERSAVEPPDAAMVTPDAGTPTPDAATPAFDAGTFDAGTPDAGTPDAGTPDAGTPDAGPRDAGIRDAGTLPPFDGGAAIAAPSDTWTWVPFSDAFCANGSTVGLGINPHPGSDHLLIFLAGGGVCWNNETCWVNRTAYGLDGYSAFNFGRTVMYELNNGVFDRNDATNPFRDWSFVWLPYCTGDLHMGSRTTQYANGPIRHVGYSNMAAFLRRIVPTFPAMQQVVLTGSSAGGFGATWNYQQVRSAFHSLPARPEVVLIDDSGPYLRAPYYSLALQQAFESAFGASANQPGCALCDPNVAGGGLHQVVPHLAANVPGFRGSLICSLRDQSIRDVLSRPPGNPSLDCTGPGTCLIEPGLQDFRTAVAQSASPGLFKVFYLDVEDHVWLGQSPGAVISNGVSLSTFLRAQLDGSSAWQDVAP